ncbi:DsbE family thiol:disulfide interchange protein [Emcibacter sp.]|uniref:DsbE family thiol:disulfide interchange protein n=1 Tax=Emcibacter sp. TaxID=1979954 RepID=UPI002AA659A3|nr:DsbE family thiol:disulfide interchange protein [Emcibacter sp.]
MRFKAILPLAIFVALAIALGVGLTLNPREIPSALIDKPVPEFSLPNLTGNDDGIAAADLAAEDDIILVNFFASWCGPCRVEHPQLERLASEYGIKIYGVAYKDRPENSLSFLENLGNPYVKTAADVTGRVGIDWGVYGIPETFIIKNGRIMHKHVGPIHEWDVEDKIIPALKQIKGEGE